MRSILRTRGGSIWRSEFVFFFFLLSFFGFLVVFFLGEVAG
jgi:hypothetical protein